MTINYQDVHLKASQVYISSLWLPILIATFFLLELSKMWHLSAFLFIRLLSNHVNRGFEASSNETKKLSIPLAVAFGAYCLLHSWQYPCYSQ